MNGLIFDIFLTNGFQLLPFIGYSLFFILDVLLYFLMAFLLKAKGFNDKLIFWYSVQVFVYLLLGFAWPVFWYLACLHFLSLFFAEIIYLMIYNNYDHIVHHIYTILFLTVVLYFTPPFVNALAVIPLLNNIAYHGAITFNIVEQTRVFRSIFFILVRIIYPIVMLTLLIIFVPILTVIKFILAFFAITIVLLMIPKLVKSCQESRDKNIEKHTKNGRNDKRESKQPFSDGFIEMGLRITNGMSCFKNDSR